MFTYAILVCALASQGTEERWPPPGPAWETDPPVAFERAREEAKGLLVYVATEDYGPCVVMAHEVWPAPDVRDASAEVIPLAVHHARQPDDSPFMSLLHPKFHGDEWCVRLNVMAYPQLRYLDGWGRPLPGLEGQELARSFEDVTSVLRMIPGAVRSLELPLPREIPYEVSRIVPKKIRDDLLSLDCTVREQVWQQVLQERRTTQELAAIFAWETDPLVRLAILQVLDGKGSKKLTRDRYVERILDASVRGDNDFVRMTAIELAVRIGGEDVSSMLIEVIDAVVEERSGWANPNNMLCTATQAAGELAPPEMLETLARVLDTTTKDNQAYRNALAAIRAIGDEGKREREVRRILEMYDD